jgi:uncharacterized protein (TIGR02246 family)
MKTKMKKLISISTIPVLALALLLVSGTVLADDTALGDPKLEPSLRCDITYNFVGHLGQFDAEGRLLVWDGNIHGDIEGVILWWFDLTRKQTIGQVSHYAARWEILDGDNALLLAGDSAGTTRVPLGEDGIWRGKGKVTVASTGFEDWLGREIYEGGDVTWDETGNPIDGEGAFRINLVLDFNGDGKVDNADVSILVGYWNTGEPVCDIGPTPLGDGIVDARDLRVLTEYLTKPDVEADIAAIEEVLNQYAVAVNTGDFELWLSLHADDVVKMGPGAPAIFGREALRANKEAAWDNFTLEMALYPEEAQVSGDLGFARGTYTLSITPKAGGETIIAVPDGKYLTLCKRQADGTWQISHDCYNSNVPPAQ